jgi:hypothetical protein
MNVFLASIIGDAICAAFKGWALSVLWGWFFVEKFGLPGLSIPQAVGVAIAVGYVCIAYRQPKTVDIKYILDGVIVSAFRAVFVVCYGWVAFQLI